MRKYPILVCLIFISFTFGESGIDCEKIMREAPLNLANIEKYVKDRECQIQEIVAEIDRKDEQELGFDGLIRAWNKVGMLYFESLAFLHSLDIVTLDQEIFKAGKIGCEKLNQSLKEVFENEKRMGKLVSFIASSLESNRLASFEKYYLTPFFLEKEHLENRENEERLGEIALHFQQEEASPFTFLQGNAERKIDSSETFTVLNWNICFLPGYLTLTYGGVFPWVCRFDKVVSFIKEKKADIVCLQEVFDEEAAFHLYENLKEEYAYFYINIGPKNLALDKSKLCLGSGLFVASKYEIQDPNWTQYKESWLEQICRGFFSFKISNEKEKMHVITTHLDASLTFGSAENFRFLQMKQLIDHLDRARSIVAEPIIVCGDLNVFWGNAEPAEGIIKQWFYDPYHSFLSDYATYCDLTGYWWPEYILNEHRKKFDPKLCVLDYALVLKALPSENVLKHNCVASVKVLEAHTPDLPEEALSDHHALLTTFFWQEKTKY